MGLTFEQICGGTRPDPRTWEFVLWKRRLDAYMLNCFTESRKARGTTYYFDSVAGDDTTGDGSIYLPWASLSKMHDVIAASSGNIRCRIKYGSEFIGLGKNYQWMATDGGHNCAVFVGKDDVTIDCYGDPEDGRVIFRIAGSLGDDWTQDGTHTNTYTTSVAAFGTVDWVYETDETVTPFTRQTSAANCNSNERSFYYDSGTTTLYVHYDGAAEPPDDLYSVDRNNISFFRPATTADDVIIDLGGATLIGSGHEATDTNTHDYAVSLGPTGTAFQIAGNFTATYGPVHICGTWNPGSGGLSGGIAAFVNVRGGRNITNTGGARVINFYQPGGLDDVFAHNVESLYPVLASTTMPFAVNGHCDTGNVKSNALFVNCLGNVNCADVGTAGVDSKLVVFGNRVKSTDGTEFNGGTSGLPSGICLNSVFPGVSATQSIIGNVPLTGYFANCFFYNKGSGTQGFSAQAQTQYGTTALTTLENNAIFEACLIHWINASNSQRGVGMVRDSLGTADRPSSVVIKRSVLSSPAVSASFPIAPGVGDSDTNQIDNHYYGISKTTTRNQAGYNNVTTYVDLTTAPIDVPGVGDTVIEDIYTPSEEMIKAGASEIEYDFYSRRRRNDVRTSGPVELMYETDSLVGARLIGRQLIGRQLIGTPLIGN